MKKSQANSVHKTFVTVFLFKIMRIFLNKLTLLADFKCKSLLSGSNLLKEF